MSKKVIEFKASVNKAMAERIALNLEACRMVWNESLAIRLEARHRYQRSQHGHDVPFGLVLRPRVIVRKKKNVVRYVGKGIVRATPKGEPCAPRCPVRLVRSQLAEGLDADAKLLNKVPTLGYWQHPIFSDPRICTRFMNGMAQFTFREAWEAYLDKTRPNSKQPRFKGKRDMPRILINASGTVKVERLNESNGYVIFPKGLKLRIKGLFDRLTAEHSRVAIVVRPSGYYVHFCIPDEPALLPANKREVGVDPGVRSVITLSTGKQFSPNPKLAMLQRRLKRLQRKLSRQQKGQPGWKKTQALIALTHEKIARSRDAFNHKLSTRLVRQFGTIAFEDTKLTNMVRRAKPKEDPDKPGTFLPNGAAAKSGLNRSLLNVAIGDLRTKTEGKANARGRIFVRVAAHHTSQTCNACGTVDPENRPNGGTRFKCRPTTYQLLHTNSI